MQRGEVWHGLPTRQREVQIVGVEVNNVEAAGVLQDQFQLHKNSAPSTVGGLPEVSEFWDKDDYWFATKPDAGVMLPQTGTTITVTGESGNVMDVTVGKR